MSRLSKSIHARLAQLRRLGPKLRIAALGEGLAACSPDESEALALELLELAVFPAFDEHAKPVRPGSLISLIQRARRAQVARVPDRALAEISRRWVFMPSAVIPAALAAGENRWQDVIRQVATDPSRLPRLSLVKLASDAGDARLAPLAASMLFDHDDEIAQAAERALVTLSLSLLRQDLARTTAAAYLIDEPDVSFGRGLVLGLSGNPDELSTQLAQAAMNHGEHRRRAPILGAIIAADRARLRSKRPGAIDLRAWIANSVHPSQGALRSVLRWSRTPIARLRALEWLHQDHLWAPARERLLRAHKLLEHELVLANSHLLARPARAARTATLKLEPRLRGPSAKRPPALPDLIQGPTPSGAALRHLSPAARLRFPSFLSAFSTTAPHRTEALEPYLSDTVPTIRHAAVRSAPTGLLTDFCFDEDRRVAQSAYLSWSPPGTGVLPARPSPAASTRLLRLLARSPHEPIRAWALQDLEAAAEPSAQTVAGRLAARRALANDRPGFLSGLRASLARDDEALGAMALVRSLNLVAELEHDLIKLTELGAPPRLLATAIAALATLTSIPAHDTISRHLTHPNDRVRANAVESLDVHTPAAIIELKVDPCHRVRANAIRAEFLAALRAGLPAPNLATDLTQILTDARPMHRQAGFWLAARTLPPMGQSRLGDQWPQLIARVGEAARFDEDARVRARAAACAYRLAAHTRLAWRSHAH